MNSQKRTTCDATCILDEEYGDWHGHYCDVAFINNQLSKERDMVNYMALKLQTLTGKSAVEEILEAKNATR